MTERRPKLIYFAERHPGFDSESFTRRWRQHARLGMSMARWVNIHRYVHCEPIDTDLPASVTRRAADGVALLWYRSQASRQRHISDQEARAIMKGDEAETFARPVADVSIMVDETVHRPAPVHAATLFLLYLRRPGITAADFTRYRRTALPARIARAFPAIGYTQNVPAEPRTTAGLAVDGIDEIAVSEPARLDLEALGEVLASVDMADMSGLWARQMPLFQAGEE